MADKPTPKELLDASKQVAELESRHKKLQQSMLESRQSIEEAYNKQFAAVDRLMDAEQKSAEMEKLRADHAAEQLKNSQATIEAMQIQLKTLKGMGKGYEALVGDLQQALFVLKQETAETKKLAQATEAVAKATATIRVNTQDTQEKAGKLLSNFAGMNETTRAVGAELTRSGNILGNMSKKTGDILRKMGASATKAGFVGAAFEKGFAAAEGMAKSVDTSVQKYGVMASLDRAKKFDTDIRLIARDVGIYSEDAMYAQAEMFDAAVEGTVHLRKAYHDMNRDMFKSSTVFRQSNDEVRGNLTRTALDLKQTFNVEAAQSTAVMQELATTFGKTGPEAASLTADLSMMATTLGRDVNKTLSDFAQMSDQLAKFGLPSATKEFGRLQAIEEKTGASMSNLVSAMDTFSTFEGALGAASKLNAAFGSTIDGMELMDKMMTGGPAEALLLLRQRMDETGQSFETMNYAQRRVMAEATGIGMGDLAKYMAVPYEELAVAVGESDKTIEGLAKSQEKLAAATEGTLTPAEAQAKLQDDTAAVMATAAKWLAKIEIWLAKVTPAWAAFGASAISAFTGLAGGIGMAIGKLLVMRMTRQVSSASEVASLTAETGASNIRTVAAINEAQAKAAARSAGGGFIGGKLGSGGSLLGRAGLYGAAIWGGVELGSHFADSGHPFGWFEDGPAQSGTIQAGQKAFAVGQNSISQPTRATVGDGGVPEIATIKGSNYLVGMGGPQTLGLGAGDSVSTLPGGSTPPQEMVMNFTFVDENGSKKTERVKRVMSEYMDENLNLSYS